MYSVPGAVVHAFLHGMLHVWHARHLSKFSTMPICTLIFIRTSF